MNSEAPKIAIIIPCYNHGQFINETIDNIQKCDPGLFELVIVNDGSTDQFTLEILNEIEKKGFRVIHQKNGGQSVARNKGISETKAPYILPVDSDNMITPELITKSVAILDNDSKVDVVYTDAILFGEVDRINSNLEFNFQKLILDNYIDTCAVIRRITFDKVGGFDPDIQGIEDWDLWLKIAFSGGKFHYIKEPLYYYRVRHNSFIRKDPTFNKKMKIRLQQKHQHILNFEYVEEYVFNKFNAAPFLFTARLFLKKYFSAFYNKLLKKGKIQKF